MELYLSAPVKDRGDINVFFINSYPPRADQVVGCEERSPVMQGAFLFKWHNCSGSDVLIINIWGLTNGNLSKLVILSENYLRKANYLICLR
jgi:hypothetical protein